MVIFLHRFVVLLPVFVIMVSFHDARGQLSARMRHIRNVPEREWSSFSVQADTAFQVLFPAGISPDGYTLEVTHADVKQDWSVTINGTRIGNLTQDEQLLTEYFAVPASLLNRANNELRISTKSQVADDISVGIVLHEGTPEALMSATIDIEIVDEEGVIVPARLTIVNERRSLQSMLCHEQDIAVRAGCLYTPHPVSLRIPSGTYTLYAGRGFEYGVDSLQLTIKAGERAKRRLVVRREVDTKGWIASDTHVHTFTHSRHGDATLEERVITLAGEGIEMPVMTDHNTYVDLRPSLEQAAGRNSNLRMSPVVGDEFTTRVGHFNVFPRVGEGKVPDAGVSDWGGVATSLRASGSEQVVVLNHARDVHNNFRPFDPSRHLSVTGISPGWQLPANAMEVINSGSQQSDFMQLFHDWFGMLNGGTMLTPIGSSDSHDVSRYIVGQGRTYIRGNDSDPGGIDTGMAIRGMMKGEVLVSCGLLVKMVVNGRYGPGELASGTRRINVVVEVLGPAWSNADSISLFMNGLSVKSAAVPGRKGVPVRQRFTWDLTTPSHDVFLVALAWGKAPHIPFWPIAKPYQPMVPEWVPHMYAASGAVWVDGDRNGTRESASDYARRMITYYNKDHSSLFKALGRYDEAVARQVAVGLWQRGVDLRSAAIADPLKRAPVQVRTGFSDVMREINQLSNSLSIERIH